MSRSSSIVVTEQDLECLEDLVGSSDSPAADRLDDELTRAEVVGEDEVPEDVVTMHNDVVYEDVSSGSQRTVRVVLPNEADAQRGWVSVLAPIGSALLGHREGEEIEWTVPGGIRRVRVVAVPH